MASQVTPMADTNKPGFLRMRTDQRKQSAQAMDGPGHLVRILQAGGQGFESPKLHFYQAKHPDPDHGRGARAINVPLARSRQLVSVIIRACPHVRRSASSSR
jgi:hypothetical protein